MFSLEHQDIDGVRRVSLGGEMTIYSAVEMKDQLLDAVAGCPAVELDLTNVSELDSAGVQVIALLKQAGDIGRGVKLIGASDSVRELLDLYRLTEEWMPDAVSTAQEAGDGDAWRYA